MKKEYKLTKEGVDELNEELQSLRDIKPEIVDKVKTAREQGDLSENAEYAAAKDELARVDGRISDIQHILKNVEVIQPQKKSSVRIGTKVELKSSTGKTVNYHIVGSMEADPLDGKISDESPIGKALNGKKVGDSAEVTLPTGKIDYKVVSIN